MSLPRCFEEAVHFFEQSCLLHSLFSRASTEISTKHCDRLLKCDNNFYFGDRILVKYYCPKCTLRLDCNFEGRSPKTPTISKSGSRGYLHATGTYQERCMFKCYVRKQLERFIFFQNVSKSDFSFACPWTIPPQNGFFELKTMSPCI